jgi:signal transduction histidine kinase/AmiR/NasT family two-component response regulator
VAVLVLLCVLVLERYAFLELEERSHERTEQTQAVVARIEALDDQLTLNAHLYVNTGAASWLARYKELEPQINEALAQARAMASSELDKHFEQRTQAANDALVVLEKSAIAAVAQGDLTRAATILASAEYRLHKAMLNESVASFGRELKQETRVANERMTYLAWSVIASSLGLMLASLWFLWLRLQLHLRTHEANFEAQQQAHAAAQLDAQRKAYILDGAALGTWQWWPQTDELVLNAQAMAIMRIAPESADAHQGVVLHQRVHPDDMQPFMLALNEHLGGITPFYACEMRARRGDGEWIWVLERGRVAERDSQGQPVLIAGTVSDITAERQASAQLRAAKEAAESANRAKSAFLATMSHEIRTPLNGVMGMTELLANTPLDASQRDAVRTIGDSSQALLHVIDEILDFSKIEANRLELELSAVAPAALGQSVVQLLKPLADARQVQIDLQIDPSMPASLMADGMRLRQVMHNLLSNAIKFSDAKQASAPRRVCMHMARDGAHWTLTVTDNGMGMDAATQARAFDPFAQGEASTTRRFGGTGLGLTISRRLVELMGGTLRLESAPGQGTRVWATLTYHAAPKAEAPPRPTSSDAPHDAPSEGPPSTPHGAAHTAAPDVAHCLHVLVAEDHPVNRAVVSRQLQLLGHRYTMTNDGEAALQRWLAEPFDLLLTDLHMPERDGYSLAAAIRAAEAQLGRERMPIFALTANAIKGEDARATEVGMDRYLTKPIGLEPLRRALQTVQPRHAATRATNLAWPRT